MTKLATLSFVIVIFVQFQQDGCALTDSDDSSQADPAAAYYDGELLLGAVLPLRTRDAETRQACGAVQLTHGLRNLEALMFTLDWLNNASVSPVKLPFRLGAIAYDCCQNAQVAVENTINLMLPSMISVYNRHSANYTVPVKLSGALGAAGKVVGMLGGVDSEVSVALASVLSPLKMPQISFLSTSRDLSNRDKFKYFLRTVPNDTHAARVIVSILQTFNWSVISAVFDDSNYGIRGFADFERIALKAGICVSVRERLLRYNADWTASDYEAVIRNLVKKSQQARVVVLYLSTGALNEFFAATQKFHEQLSDMVWIGTDSWFGFDELHNEANKAITTRAIVLTPLVHPMPAGYEQYWNRIRPFENATQRNPWLAEYVENHCNCSYNLSSRFHPYSKLNPLQSCHEIERQCLAQVWIDNGVHPQLHHVVEATLAFAYGLKRLSELSNCKQRRSLSEPLCDAMTPERLDRQLLMKILRNIQFPYGDHYFRFEDGIDGPAEYSVFFWDDGRWNVGGTTNSSAINMSSISSRFFSSPVLQVSSGCEVCGPRQIRWIVEGTCCWTCVNCSSNQKVVRANWSAATTNRQDYAGDRCHTCGEGSYVDYETNECVQFAEVTMNYSTWQAIPVLIFCLVGLTITLLTMLCFWRYRETPVVKACGRETSVFLLLAAALSYTAPLIIVSSPDVLVCSITRCAAGLCMTLAYSALFTKALRIAVIFSAKQAQSNSARYCTAKFQAYAILLLIGVEMLIELAWLVYEPSQVRDHYDLAHKTFEVVCVEITKTYTIMLVLPACILLVAAVFAFRIRKTPDGFNDAKSLGFVIYTNCALMLAVLPSLISSTFAYKLRIVSLCILLHFSASSILYGLLLPKVYICVFRPEKNTKQAVMNRSRTFTSVNALPAMHSNQGWSPRATQSNTESTTSACHSAMLACIGLAESHQSKRDQNSVYEMEAPSTREPEDSVNAPYDDSSPPDTNSNSNSAHVHHAAFCACQCNCCVNWNRLNAQQVHKRRVKLLRPSSVHFDEFNDESTALRQSEDQHLTAPHSNFDNSSDINT